MENVTVLDNSYHNYERKVKLNNGTIVLHCNVKKQVVAAYMVVSFRGTIQSYCAEPTSGYCTFVDLDTGKFKFEERCSRNTTEKRILSHLNRGGSAADLIEKGDYLRIYDKGSCKINLKPISEAIKHDYYSDDYE